eukprot:85781-Amphidinium_carterae.2
MPHRRRSEKLVKERVKAAFIIFPTPRKFTWHTMRQGRAFQYDMTDMPTVKSCCKSMPCNFT